MKGLFGDLNNRLFTADGLNQTIADPRFQMGIGLLGRTDQPFGRAMGRTMQDMSRMQALQQENQRRQAEADRLAQQQQTIAQRMPHLAGLPPEMQQAGFAASLQQPQAPKTAGGMQWNGTEWVKIPGWTNTAPTASVTMPGKLSPYEEGIQKGRVEQIKAGQTAGFDARRRLVQINELERLQSTAGSGFLPAVQAYAANYGLKLGENVNEIQAFDALINQLVPQQRPPGSGPMSDSDVLMFKKSLPRLINQPGGNQLIIGLLRGIAEYDVKIGNIYNQMMTGRLGYEDGIKQIESVENPLAVLRDGPEAKHSADESARRKQLIEQIKSQRGG